MNKNINVGQHVTLSFEILYKYLENKNGVIDNTVKLSEPNTYIEFSVDYNNEYYDITTTKDGIVGMDGETFIITQILNDKIQLKGPIFDEEYSFWLSAEEFNIAVFN